MVFWNTLEISDPPTQLCNVSTSVFRKADLVKIEKTLSSATLTLNSLSQLHSEAALLSRMLYKQKTKFRHDKGFKKLEKVNRGLLKYLAFDIARVYTKFHKLLPECHEEFEFALPSKHMLEWVLVCTQGFAKLFCVVADTCEETACFWKANIKHTNMCNLSLLMLGVLGRIWSYAKFLVQNACGWFSELRPYCNILLPKGLTWLPKGYEIPDDLKTWLKSPHITNHSTGEKSLQNKTSQKRIFDLIDLKDNDGLDCETPYTCNDDIVQLTNSSCVEDSNEVVPRKKMKRDKNVLFKTNVMPLVRTDITNHGEVVPRNTIKTIDSKVPLFANSMSIEDFGIEVPRNDTKTENKISRNNKKRLKCSSLGNDFNNKSQIDSNSDLGNTILESKPTLDSKSLPLKRKKKKKSTSKSSKLIQFNRFETTDNTECSTSTVDGSKGKHKVQKLSLDHSLNENQTSEIGVEKGILSVSKRKRKNKSKLDRLKLNSLVDAFKSKSTTNFNNQLKSINNQLSKQSNKKKVKKHKGKGKK